MTAGRLLVVASILLVAAGGLAAVQFLSSDVADWPKWEDFLASAAVVGSEQLSGPDAVTNPLKLTLEKDGVRRFGLWKYVNGRDGDVLDSWRYEIAAYRVDRLLDLNIVSPTIERDYKNKKGSLQLWVDGTKSVKSYGRGGPVIPAELSGAWNRTTYIQRVFDDLIGNGDRNANNILVLPDLRIVLIDHSRAFRTSREYTKKLPFAEDGLMKAPDGNSFPFRNLPRSLYDKIMALDAKRIKAAVGPYLTDAEIAAVLARRELLRTEIATLIQRNGEDRVLY